MISQGNEEMLAGADQIMAVIEGRPKPLYEPIQTVEEKINELEEVLGFGLTPSPSALGSRLIIDDGFSEWEVNVDRIEYSQQLIFAPGGDISTVYNPEGRFAILFLGATNRGRKTDFFFPYGLNIVDAAGNEYDHDELATLYVEYNYGVESLAHETHPGEVATAIAVYDIPIDGGPYTLSTRWMPGQPGNSVFLDIN